MTENQKMLARYLKAVGCDAASIVRIIEQTWEEDKTIAMLEFCRDNPDASPAELFAMSSTIASQDEAM